jgi:hypothetical protein
VADVLLTLVVPDSVAEQVEDFLLSRPDLVRGFTVTRADGHGSLVPLLEVAELVAGHAPRHLIRTLGEADTMRAVLAALRAAMPGVHVYYWLTPVLEAGRL